MTFWSRYDAVSQPRGNTDHWSKMKLKVNTLPVEDGDVMSSWVSPTSNHDMSGVGGRRYLDNTFNDAVANSLGNLPGSYHTSRSRTTLPPISLRNSYNDRAREGFRYWLVEKPKPTSYGRYGMGSFKTVLGVGNAPRT